MASLAALKADVREERTAGSTPVLSAQLCDYGCGRTAIRFFTCTKRWCCSNSVNQCPAKRERDASQKRGKNPFEGRQHPRGMLGKKSWNHGLQTPLKTRQKLKVALTNNPKCKGVASTPEKEELRRQHIRDTAKKYGQIGGYREGSGRVRWHVHISPIAGSVSLNGSWEVAYAQYLDAHNIEWKKNDKWFHYEWEGSLHKYFPDFYLIEIDEFVEIKGRIVPKDYAKWEAVRKTETLTVLRYQDLRSLGLLGKSTR